MSEVISTPSQREDAFWWQGGLYRMKARAADTGGSLGLVEASLYGGFGPPLHVHRREDEAFYVIEGRSAFAKAKRRSSAAQAHGSGDRATCRTPSRSSPSGRGR